MKTQEESYQIGFRDGQNCGDYMLKMYDVNELLEKLRNPNLKYEDIYYKEHMKSDEILKKEGIDYDAYKKGFCHGCRDIITVGNEHRELGVGD